MTAKLLTDVTVEDICDGFVYNELEGKGLYGWGGKLVIQPEYQRNYIYADGKADVAVVQSLIKEYPIGLLYFLKVGEDKYEVLDGQQRITSFGRFVREKFAFVDENGMPQTFGGLDKEVREKFLKTKLTIYICEGEEKDVKAWFKTINIVGKPLNDQELLNANYFGPFVSAARAVFSNSSNSKMQMWKNYVDGDEKRQQVLAEALRWVSKDNVEDYMSRHRQDADISELKMYFESVIDWIDGVFKGVKDEMRGLDWGRLYETYHTHAYSPDKLWDRVEALYGDETVESMDRKGIFEYVLGGEKHPELLHIRVFNKKLIKEVYAKQTAKAKKKSVSNCPLCAIGHDSKTKHIYELSEMDADHVTAWSKGGATDAANCQMLCKTHNRAKGNR